MDEATAVIESQVDSLRQLGMEKVLEPAHARSLCDYLRALSLVEKDRRDAHKEGASDAKVLTQEELELEILKAAKEIEARHAWQLQIQ
jgi:hypothetical protein